MTGLAGLQGMVLGQRHRGVRSPVSTVELDQ